MDLFPPDVYNAERLEVIHESPYKISLVVSGCGTSALDALHSLPGSSRTMLESVVPYHADATRIYLDYPADVWETMEWQYVSENAAVELAATALRRAKQISGGQSGTLGVSLTGSIRTNREKRGPHHVYMAICDISSRTTVGHLQIEKGAKRSRADEERLVSLSLLAFLEWGTHTRVSHPEIYSKEAGDKLEFWTVE